MIHIVCALRCEANPFIKHFRLKAEKKSDGFSIFCNQHIRLIISGHGKTAAAMAIGYLHGHYDVRDSIWLNVGIAGSGGDELGQLFWIKKICNQGSGNSYFPIATFPAEIPAHSLITCDRPEENYQQTALYDMEGSAFFEAASRITSAEWVHLLKVVSDNPDNSSKQVSAKLAEQLITNHLPRIAGFIEHYSQARQQTYSDISVKHVYEQLQAQWHLSVYQSKQLYRFLNRLVALQRLDEMLPELRRFQNSKPALQWLEQQLARTSLSL